MTDETARSKLVPFPTDREEPATKPTDREEPATKDEQPKNPFANLDALRNPQDYEEFMSGEAVTKFAVRTLKEGMYLRVNPDPAYTLLTQYTVTTKNDGTYFVYPQFREALGPLPQRCN